MSPAQKYLEQLRLNPGNWSARAELAHAWREGGVDFADEQLFSGAVGAPRNRGELKRLLDAFPGPPRSACWDKVLNDYLTWTPGCPLGLVSLAHVTEAQGDIDEATALYWKAVDYDPSVAEPTLECLRPADKIPVPEDDSPRGFLEDPKYLSLTVGVAVHLVLIVLLSLLTISSKGPAPPQIVASLPAENVSQSSEAPPKVELAPVTAMGADQVVFAPVTMDVPTSLAAPANMEISPLVGGNTFGLGMDLDGGSGGQVSFFGSRGKTKKMVYVVDVSGSMEQAGESGKLRVELMKEELSRSVSALPLSVKYQIIFFSSDAWFIGRDSDKHSNQSTSNSKHLPTYELVRATQSQKRKTLKQIEEVETGGGTNWRLPLKMAINLEPDLIYFMTDGEITADRGDTPVIEDVVSFNRDKGRSRINTICLMELEAYDELKDLARRTNGNVFLVKEDGEVLRGMEIDRER